MPKGDKYIELNNWLNNKNENEYTIKFYDVKNILGFFFLRHILFDNSDSGQKDWYLLNDYLFDWDPRKNLINLQKHGVSFNEAATVFQDENALYFDDINHSQDENRFIIVGLSKIERLLIVCHCYRENDTVIRIISARKAEKSEIELYGGI